VGKDEGEQTHGFARQDQRILTPMLTDDLDGRLLGIPHEVILDPAHRTTGYLGIDAPRLNPLGLHDFQSDWSRK
jgi:hypothetical protein